MQSRPDLLLLMNLRRRVDCLGFILGGQCVSVLRTTHVYYTGTAGFRSRLVQHDWAQLLNQSS